jgi:inward rectifier potassium channel
MASPAPPPPPSTWKRTLDRDGSFNTVRIGFGKQGTRDVYHYLLAATWPRFLGVIGGAYLVTNTLFAVLFYLGGDCIQGARPGSFEDVFFFSIHTLATIGYGSMSPATLYAHVVVTMEALVGLLGLAVGTGLMFARFSRPTARVEWSRVAVLSRRNGVPHLVFRVANVRANQIVEASMRVVLLWFEVTSEGERMRRFIDLPLVRAQNPVFALTWQVMHAIDASSPLAGKTDEEMVAARAEILAMLVGIDSTLNQTIYARHSYQPSELIHDARFVDMIRELPTGEREIDLSRIHDYVPLGPAPASSD